MQDIKRFCKTCNEEIVGKFTGAGYIEEKTHKLLRVPKEKQIHSDIDEYYCLSCDKELDLNIDTYCAKSTVTITEEATNSTSKLLLSPCCNEPVLAQASSCSAPVKEDGSIYAESIVFNDLDIIAGCLKCGNSLDY